MKNYFLFFVISSFFFTSCNRDSQNNLYNNGPCDLNEINIVGSYDIIGVKLKQTPTSNNIDVYNSPNYFKQCRKDDVLTINSNATFINDDGAIVCNPVSNNSSGTWTLSGFTFNTIGNIENEQFTVQNYNCIGMDLKIDYKIVNATISLIYNLKRR